MKPESSVVRCMHAASMIKWLCQRIPLCRAPSALHLPAPFLPSSRPSTRRCHALPCCYDRTISSLTLLILLPSTSELTKDTHHQSKRHQNCQTLHDANFDHVAKHSKPQAA
jgi:hypothetical protein